MDVRGRGELFVGSFKRRSTVYTVPYSDNKRLSAVSSQYGNYRIMLGSTCRLGSMKGQVIVNKL